MALWLASLMPRPSIWRELIRSQFWQPFANPVKCAGNAALHKAARFAKSHTDHAIDTTRSIRC